MFYSSGFMVRFSLKVKIPLVREVEKIVRCSAGTT
jgi:hypothetical protein